MGLQSWLFVKALDVGEFADLGGSGQRHRSIPAPICASGMDFKLLSSSKDFSAACREKSMSLFLVCWEGRGIVGRTNLHEVIVFPFALLDEVGKLSRE